MNSPKYPDITVKLVGEDGNAFAIIGRVKAALRHGNASQSDINEFVEKVISSDYNNVIGTCLEYVNVE